MKKSKTDIAYEIIKENKGGISFKTLWQEVGKINNFYQEELDERISYFYTDLTLDGRFITLGENIWDLRENHSFEKVHIDMNEIYSESEEEIIEVDEGLVAKVDTNEELFEEEADEVEEEK